MKLYRALVVIIRDADTALPTPKAGEILDLGTYDKIEDAKEKLSTWDGPADVFTIRVVDESGDDIDETIYL